MDLDQSRQAGKSSLSFRNGRKKVVADNKFAILTPLEPRLVRKLLPPITNLISSTSAISLLYECVRTCIVGGMLDPDRPESDALARVCVEKLGGYLRDEGGDQNRVSYRLIRLWLNKADLQCGTYLYLQW